MDANFFTESELAAFRAADAQMRDAPTRRTRQAPDEGDAAENAQLWADYIDARIAAAIQKDWDDIRVEAIGQAMSQYATKRLQTFAGEQGVRVAALEKELEQLRAEIAQINKHKNEDSDNVVLDFRRARTNAA